MACREGTRRLLPPAALQEMIHGVPISCPPLSLVWPRCPSRPNCSARPRSSWRWRGCSISALARANPRWRVLLWRTLGVGLVLLPLWALGAVPWMVVAGGGDRGSSTGSGGDRTGTSDCPTSFRAGRDRPRSGGMEAGRPTLGGRTKGQPVHGHGQAAPASDDAAPSSSPPAVEIPPQATPVAEPRNASIPWLAVLLSVWGSGVLLLVVRLAIGYICLARLLRAWRGRPRGSPRRGPAHRHGPRLPPRRRGPRLPASRHAAGLRPAAARDRPARADVRAGLLSAIAGCSRRTSRRMFGRGIGAGARVFRCFRSCSGFIR